MSSPAVKAVSLSKSFRIGARQPAYRTIREAVMQALASPFRRLAGKAPEIAERLDALTDVSFEVAPGEALGLIGRNGAGKSTLLKILSRITEPSSGHAEIRGIVASLLEVGTGFHPELTGRENVFLNGALLGMKRADVLRRFDEIVAFAEVERFVDTPVKHYSSGMYLRLAFAVAAHLEPEILIIDEVLAVGDATFQRKCLGKMDALARSGRTLLFVSHNLSAVARLCGRAIWLDGGRVRAEGAPGQVIEAYTEAQESMGSRAFDVAGAVPGDDVARLASVRVLQEGRVRTSLEIHKPVELEMVFECLREGEPLVPMFHIFSDGGVHLFTGARFSPPGPETLARGRWVARAVVPPNLLAEGVYALGVEVMSRGSQHSRFLVRDVAALRVVDTGEAASVRGSWAGPIYGLMRPALEVTLRPESAG